jgi:hypothetical protein
MVTGNRNGFALPAAIGGLVIVGVLVTTGFYMARQEVRIGIASKHAAMATNIAQTGANEIMANWNGYQLSSIAVWDDTTIVDTLPNGIWTVSVTNVNNKIYFLNAEGEVTDGGALWSGGTRRVGIVTRMISANIDPPAALTTRGKTTIKGGAEVHGEDVQPSGWGGYCPGGLTDKPGVLTNDTSQLSGLGVATVSGTPAYDQDSTIVDSTFTTFGDMTWAELTALASAEGKDVSSLRPTINVTAPDTTASGACNEATLTNWGDTLPTAPCGAYFPLIYVNGNITIQSGGIGQGILLVDGDLDLRGNFLFYGLIVVQGNFETQGNGNRVVGAVMASNASVDQQTVTGTSEVSYSRCTVARAILNNASLSRARPVAQRSWVDLTAVAH